MPDNQTTGNQTCIEASSDFPPVGTVWSWFDMRKRMGRWEVLGYLQGQNGTEVISRLESDRQITVSHPLELLTFKFSGAWNQDGDFYANETRLKEFTDIYPQYDFVLSTFGWVQIPEGYIAYTPDRVIWGIGSTADDAIKNGKEFLEEVPDYTGDEVLSTVRATIDVDAYVHEHSGQDVPWAIISGVAWLTADIECKPTFEKRALPHVK